MTTKIEGLKYHFTNVELADHMQKRAMYHDQRADEKEKALPELKASLEKVKKHAPAAGLGDLGKMSGHRGYQLGNPDQDLEADIKNHKNKAIVFRALAAHVVKDATYELDESDLKRLEILKEDY